MVVSDAQKRANKKYRETHKEKVNEISQKYKDAHRQEVNEKERIRMNEKYNTDEEYRRKKLEKMKAHRELKKLEQKEILVN